MFPVIWHNLIVTSFFLRKIIRVITQDIENVEQNFQVVTYSTVCTGHIQHDNDDVIIVEVTMTRQIFEKLLNPEITRK